MDYSSVWAIWAVAISGPCVISWLVGDIAGSARTRELYDEKHRVTDADEAERQAYPAGVVEEWRVSGVTHPLVSAVNQEDPPDFRSPTFTEKAARAERRRLQRTAFTVPTASIGGDWIQLTEGPSLQTTGTRSDDRKTDQILRHYARSIGDLHIKRGLEVDSAAHSWSVGVRIMDERDVSASRPW
ncbi:MAG: hypothetical protein AAF249_08190 [Pseudomonadota bacterium]